jgi:O-antigen/teichoic acid export membrane protein
MQLRRWRHLFSDTAYIFVTYMARTVSWQGDYIMLGRLHGADVVGVYFFAFTLSTQTLFLLTGNLSTVMFPALNRLSEEPERQGAAFRQAIGVLALIGIPMALLQAAVADPVVRLVFPERWYDGIGVLQVLSVGMAIRMVGALGASLTQANGRFRLQAGIDGGYAVLFLTAVAIGASLGAALMVATMVAVCSSIFGVVNLYVAMRLIGGGWRDAIVPYVWPALIGGAACAAGWGAAQMIVLTEREMTQQALRLVVTLAVSAALYLPLIRAADRPTWNHAMMRLRSLLRRGDG